MYLKDFEIRWSDVDANRHLANSAYINFIITFIIIKGRILTIVKSWVHLKTRKLTGLTNEFLKSFSGEENRRVLES